MTGASYHDANGNAGAAFTGPSLEVNTQGPSVTGITLGSALLDGSTPSTTITVNFSEKVTDFVGSDLVLPAGVTLSNGVLAANGLSFTATLTAGANIADETQAIAVTGASYHDANGNAGAAFAGPSLEVNTQGPSVTGITLGSALLDGSTPSTTITVNFSEKVTDFIGTDLVLPAGVTLSNGVLAANGLSFTATLTAGANIADETRAVTVTGGSYHDANGNAGAAFTGPSLEVNTQGPSVTGITLGSALLDGSTPSTTITVNFSEKVTDFVGTDLVLPAGVTLSNGVLAANGLSFTATLTAGANIADETRAVTVTGGSYHDANGNAGAAFTGPSLEVNTQGPSVTGITLGSALLDGSTPSTTITVNFSEKVTDFIGTDLVLPAGVTLSNGVLAANGLSFTATLTAGANIADETQAIAVTGGSYHDANGNAGAAFTGPSLEVNTLPVLTVGVSSRRQSSRSGRPDPGRDSDRRR